MFSAIPGEEGGRKGRREGGRRRERAGREGGREGGREILTVTVTMTHCYDYLSALSSDSAILGCSLTDESAMTSSENTEAITSTSHHILTYTHACTHK